MKTDILKYFLTEEVISNFLVECVHMKVRPVENLAYLFGDCYLKIKVKTV